jgi:hypothetical protein
MVRELHPLVEVVGSLSSGSHHVIVTRRSYALRVPHQGGRSSRTLQVLTPHRLLFLAPLVLLPVYWFWLAARVVLPWLAEQRRTPEGYVVAFNPNATLALVCLVTLAAMAMTYLLVFGVSSRMRRSGASS